MAIKRLSLKDFVIVDQLEIELTSGYTALTGETGAGKSILIDALQLALGARADASVVREGCLRAEISVEFERSPALDAWLDEAGYPREDSLLLRRVIESSPLDGQDIQTAKSRAWINGSPATATQLRALGEQLLDIHGQHAWQSLTRADAVRELLDAYAKVDRSALESAWQHWRQAQQALREAEAAQDHLQSERERLAWQIGELEKLAPLEAEWEDLQTEHKRLANAQGLLDAAQRALQALEPEDESGCGALRQLGLASQALADHQDSEPAFRAWADILAQSLAQAEDATHSLHSYLRKSGPDPERLAELDERMALWLALARRYRRPPEALPTLLAEWHATAHRLETASDLEALRSQEQTAAQAYQRAAAEISRLRHGAAPRLGRAISQAMQGLGMQGGRFEVRLSAIPASAHGLEQIEFLAAGHAGSTPRPVAKVASGGELSRMALAIAVTTSRLGTAQTLIFDEVDSGVGGAVAETVGQLMRQLGADRQVLAVTHLPQVAACAHHHLVVHKRQQGRQTLSTIQPVHAEQRVSEIGRMLGGEKLSATTLAHAREMLRKAAP
jgi:DNA repair protein RecN (Recombination protein N)